MTFEDLSLSRDLLRRGVRAAGPLRGRDLVSRPLHPDDGLILRRAQVLAPAVGALAILDWINDRPALYFGTIDAAVLAACDAINDTEA
jgi:hypothetical protein